MFHDRRRYAVRLTVLVSALAGLIALTWPNMPVLNGKVSAQTPSPTPSPTPWQSDPMGSPGNYTLFRNDNIFIAGNVSYGRSSGKWCQGDELGGYSNQKFTAKPNVPLDGNGFDAANINNVSSTGIFVDYRYASGSGRILKPDSEQGVIYKLLNYADSAACSPSGAVLGQVTYYVNVFDSSGTLWEHTFPAVCASRVSHLDVAVGDLDRRRDASGEYRDEIVLVSESGNRTMQLTVISLLTAADASWTNCADEHGTCTFDGTKRVRYGANGTYRYGMFTGGVNCSNDVFGDPLEGAVKACDYQASPTPQITTLDTRVPVGYYIDQTINSEYNRGGQVSVATGDFDGDGRMEIAASTVSEGGDVWLSVFRYANDGQNSPRLTTTVSKDLYVTNRFDNTNAYQYADIAAGDFRGSGHDQVMIGVVAQNNRAIWVTGYDFNSDLTAFTQFAGTPSSLGSANNGVTGSPSDGITNLGDTINWEGWVQLKAGLFKYDPFNGYGVRRRQLGVMFGNARPAVGILEVLPTDNTKIQWLPGAGLRNLDDFSGSAYGIWRQGPSVGGYIPDMREAYTLMAGNFGGKDSQNPAWQLAAVAPYKTTTNAHINNCTDIYLQYSEFELGYAIAAWQYTHGEGTPASPYTFSFQNLSVPAAVNGTWNWRTQGSRNIAAVALDLDGNSLRLGAPVKITVDNLLTTDAVLQEPPKHLDWTCGQNFGQVGAECDFVNVSRYKGFNITYTDESGTDTSNEVTSTADTSVGKSSAKTAEETLSAGVPEIASLDLDFEQKFESESDFKTSQENYNKSTTGRSFTYESATEQADEIYSRTRTLVVYRYPLYGKPDPNNPGQTKFYDLTLPVETDVVSSPGDTSEWYQPIHENGNLLTYPYLPAFDPSSDYGFYAVGQEGKCSVSTILSCRQSSDCPAGETCSGALPGLLGNSVVNIFGSNPTKISINYSQTGTTGAKLLTSQTLKSSEELKFGFKANWSLPLEDADVGGSVGGSLQYNTSDESSWSQASVSESTTSSAQGLVINQPGISSVNNYQYKTWAYIAAGGFLKVAHAADVIGTGVGSWYAETYGQTYDLSLNLPRKFLEDESDSTKDGVFTLNTDISRKETKSLSISDPDVPTTDGAPAYISGAVVVDPKASEGKTLQLNARVYNLSTKFGIDGTNPNLVARFELVSYDPTDAKEGPRQTVAEAQIPAIDFYASPGCTASEPNYPMCNSVVVSAKWDTTGVTPGQYRLYVVLDPANSLPNEYHEWQDRRTDPLLQVNGDPDPGQPVDDNRQDANGQLFHLEKGQNNEGWMYVQVIAPSADTVSNRTPELSMAKNSLAADTFAAEPDAIRPRANIHTPVRIRARIDSDGDNLGHQHVMFFDRDPDKGGKPFAVRLLRGVTKGANHLWVTYTPHELGRQTIWARVVEHAADPKPGNHTTSVVLIVRPADKQPPQLFVALTPSVLSSPDNRMVEVVATVLAADNQDRAPRVRLEAITYNDGNDVSPDAAGAAFGTDDRQFALRAKRAARGEEPVIYEVVYSATDRSGNKTFAKAYVTVPSRRQR